VASAPLAPSRRLYPRSEHSQHDLVTASENWRPFRISRSSRSVLAREHCLDLQRSSLRLGVCEQMMLHPFARTPSLG
jgi:hypothetical protein